MFNPNETAGPSATERQVGSHEHVTLQFSMSLVMATNGEDPDFVGQRMNSAIFQALHQAGLTQRCPDSDATVVSHSFNLNFDESPATADMPLISL